MVVWLKRHQALGVDGDVILAANRHRVVELAMAWGALEEERDRILAQARVQAETILEDARAVAAELNDEARRRAEKSGRLGYAAGHRKALSEFHAAMTARTVDDAMVEYRLQSRLLATVMQAVECVVLETDRQALFARVAATLGKLLQSQVRLTVRVHPIDVEAARASFSGAAAGSAICAMVEVLADEHAQLGDCRCEWDYGVADASLSTQVAALREALKACAGKAPRPVSDVDDATIVQYADDANNG